MADRLTLDQCGQKRHFQGLASGSYLIEYTDSTHLQSTDWVKLAEVNVRAATIPLEGSATEQFYTITKAIGVIPGERRPNGSGNADSGDSGRHARTVEDTLALALGRVGLITPEITADLIEQLLYLDEQDGVVIVPDTNALHNGAVHWLLRVLRRPSVWLMPVVASLTTIQTRDATVKGLVNKYKISNLTQALRSRGLVNGALGLLERNKGRCQVVEIDPSLLRYQKLSSSSGADPDQSDVLEDRLIIEAIHGVLRSMRSRITRRVVTSDVNIARVLSAEGIDTLFIPTISLGNAPIECLRFDAIARSFAGAPLRCTLWELAHAFGTVRLVKDEIEQVRLECYWPGKTPAQWASETLECTFAEKEGQKLTPLDVRGEELSSNAGKEVSPSVPSSAPTVNASTTGKRDEPSPLLSADPPPKRLERASKKAPVPITAALPRAALTQIFRLLGIARRLSGGTAEQFVAEMGQDAISIEKARRPLEILRRLRLVDQNDDHFQPTADANTVDAALLSGDLDVISGFMERFEPYKLFLGALKQEGRVSRSNVASLVFELIGRAGAEESERLPRFHILLGQAWTNGDWIMDGSNRPIDRDATDAFEQSFRATSTVGIAKIQDLLLHYCEASRMSPWAAKRQIERFVASRMLPEYSFQPAAGGKPITRDEVMAGSLDRPTTEQVIIDRIFLGERPVFTVEGPSQ